MDAELSEIHALEGANRTLKQIRELVVEYRSQALREKLGNHLEFYGFNVAEPKLLKGLQWFKGCTLLNLRQISRKYVPDFMKLVTPKMKRERISRKRWILHAAKGSRSVSFDPRALSVL